MFEQCRDVLHKCTLKNASNGEFCYAFFTPIKQLATLKKLSLCVLSVGNSELKMQAADLQALDPHIYKNSQKCKISFAGDLWLGEQSVNTEAESTLKKG